MTEPQYPPYPQYPHQPPPQPRSSRWPWIVGVALAAVLVLVAGLVAVVVVLKADDRPQEFAVTYEVIGSGSARVDYWDVDGRSTPEVVPLPWRQDVVMRGETPFVSVSAVHEQASSLRCRIIADGKTVSEDESSRGSIGCDGYLGET